MEWLAQRTSTRRCNWATIIRRVCWRGADELGLDLVLAVLEGVLHETRDLTYRPHPLLKRMVYAGQVGKASGRGFFEY